MESLFVAALAAPTMAQAPPTVVALAPAEPDAVSRFGAAMELNDAAPVAEVAPASKSSQSVDRSTLGDAILDSLNTAGENYRTRRAEFHESVDSAFNDLSITGLLRLQMRMAEMSLNIELITKGVAKVCQHVDQLTKLQ